MSKQATFSQELKIGILVIVSGIVLYVGFNFLKGINVFNPSNYYCVPFKNVDGLLETAPIYIQGYKVGMVNEIRYDFSKEEPFVVILDIERGVKIPQGTIAELQDDGLVSGKCIHLNFHDNYSNFLESGDTIPSVVIPSLINEITSKLLPKIDQVVTSADSLLVSIRNITDSKEVSNSLTSIEGITTNLETTSKDLKQIVKNDVPKVLNNVDSLTGNLATISNNVKRVDFEKTIQGVDSTVSELNLVVKKINNNEGALGKLINDDELYKNLTSVSSNADSLLIDLKANPKRYVHFSVFGKKDKK